MNENKNLDDNSQVEEMLNSLYQEGPTNTMIIIAEKNLKGSLKDFKGNTIFYGSMTHPTIETLFLAMRRERIVAIDFGIDEEDFMIKIEKQYDAPVYFGLDETKVALDEIKNYLDGQRTNFDLPTDISILTEFQQQVLQATQQIPRGRIATYMDIARKIGNPKAVRAVGQALGRNPIPIVIPCHRVIASNGSLGGYSGGGGLKTKAKLLQLEGANLF